MTNDNTLQWLGANILLPDGRELSAGERLHFQGGHIIGYQGVEQKVINTLTPIFFPSVSKETKVLIFVFRISTLSAQSMCTVV